MHLALSEMLYEKLIRKKHFLDQKKKRRMVLFLRFMWPLQLSSHVHGKMKVSNAATGGVL